MVVNGSQDNIQLWDLRRLREDLTALGLDWPAPPLAAPLPGAAGEVKSLTVLPSVSGLLNLLK